MVLIALIVAVLFGVETSQERHQLTAAEIMQRVAENQDREQNARNDFVYDQKVHLTMRRKNGKLIHEEYRVYSMTPGPKGTERKLTSVRGRYWKNGQYISFEGEPIPPSLISITLDDDDTDETRDGIDKDLFPLTTDHQKEYTFERSGERVIHGRPAYEIQFRPADKHDYGWTGEALIDQEEFQPVSVYTRLSRKLPLAVRTMLGTDVPGLGFNIEYKRVDKDIWFPSSYGTEFRIRALFLLNRFLAESTENVNFRRTTVESQIDFASGPARY